MRLAFDPQAEEEWDTFVKSHPDGTFFHLSAWRRVMAKAFGHRTHFVLARSEGAITGVLPLVEIRSLLFGHALIANAFCVGGGPLWTDDAAFATLIAEAEEIGRQLGVDYVELRDLPVAPAGWTTRSGLYANFRREMAADEAERLKQIPRKQRAVVRKALGHSLEVTIDRTPKAFFELYARNVSAHGTPALPRRFFDILLDTFGNDCEILTVHRDGVALSSVLSYYYARDVMPYYTGSLPGARALGANDLMYWSLMRRGIERGCEVFDFGRSKLGTGPYDFKRNWGFEPRATAHQFLLLNGERLPEVNPTNPRYAPLIAVWKRLPLPLVTAISPILSRNLA